ncbi:MAG TPA: alanine racemase C-terminal domain-containing protein, partial [Rubrivivax sp.]|nr:alanine racemase C-terminal domain-containing protein [Rubrivivax sp.]
ADDAQSFLFLGAGVVGKQDGQAAAPGSEVTLWGEGPLAARLPIDEVAQAAGTIGYELMCALAQRVPVRVVD